MGPPRLAAGATGPFELGGEFLEKGRVSGQALDNRHRLSLSSRLFNSESSSDPIRYRLIQSGGTTAALLRPTALRTHPTLVSGIDGTWFPALAHNLQLTFGIPSCHPALTRKRSKMRSRGSSPGVWEFMLVFTPYLCHSVNPDVVHRPGLIGGGHGNHRRTQRPAVFPGCRSAA